MVAVRRLLQIWRPSLIVYGCSAHYMNLVEAKATPKSIMSKIIAVNRYFRDHQRPAGVLKENGGVSPQLPNETRWTSQRAAFQSFVINHPLMVQIRDSYESEIKDEIRIILDDRQVLVEAKRMLKQLESVSQALNLLQSDSTDLSVCTQSWLSVMNEESINAEVKDDLLRRSDQALTVYHKIGYFLDNRLLRNFDNQTNRPELSQIDEEEIRSFFAEKSESFSMILAAYETKDVSVFPSITFNPSMGKLQPVKYWKYIGKISRENAVKDFCQFMEHIFACPSSSAGIERIFSIAGGIHTKERNRLGSKTVDKLIKVYRYHNAN